ncbi:MAG: hypothetical protein QM778_33650 [Myxococcales bacterium]
MESCSARVLALSLLFGLGAFSQALDPKIAQAAPVLELKAPRKAQEVAPPQTGRAEEEPVAWDCVPNYWWGYWTWAWQPCAWIDRTYVEGTIGAVADARTDAMPVAPRE